MNYNSVPKWAKYQFNGKSVNENYIDWKKHQQQEQKEKILADRRQKQRDEETAERIKEEAGREAAAAAIAVLSAFDSEIDVSIPIRL